MHHATTKTALVSVQVILAESPVVHVAGVLDLLLGGCALALVGEAPHEALRRPDAGTRLAIGTLLALLCSTNRCEVTLHCLALFHSEIGSIKQYYYTKN